MERLIILANAVLVAILAFAQSPEADAEGFMVFGDSQSFVVQDTNDASKNWPHILQSATGKHFFNLSRGGRKLSDGHVADYLRLADVHRLNQQADTVLIALGSLDALFKTDPIPALSDAIQEAQARELDVVCILPPDNQLMVNDSIRADIAAVCPQSIDISQYVGPEHMIDPVHLGEEGHRQYAGGVFIELLTLGISAGEGKG